MQRLERAWMILLAEEQAEIIARKLSGKVAVTVKYAPLREKRERRGRTRRRVEKSRTISGNFDVISTHRPGLLREFTVVSPSPNFRIFMKLDDEVIYNDAWSYLAGLSQYAQEYTAYTQGGKYWFNTGNWRWSQTCLVRVGALEQITFEVIYAVWDEW